jgi:hypothetical protein
MVSYLQHFVSQLLGRVTATVEYDADGAGMRPVALSTGVLPWLGDLDQVPYGGATVGFPRLTSRPDVQDVA